MEGFPRLVFENSEDEQDIRVNMKLLFEALRASNSLPVSSTGKVFDCEKANLIKSFDTEDCFVCGSLDPDFRVKCRKCNCHFHSYCYAMARVPEADEKVSLPRIFGWLLEAILINTIVVLPTMYQDYRPTRKPKSRYPGNGHPWSSKSYARARR
jgi:hypothetical protein